MKKVISVFLICLIFSVSCFAYEFEAPPLVDGAKYLTQSQAEEIAERLEAIRQKYNFDVAIVTEKEMSSSDAMSAADDIFDYNGLCGKLCQGRKSKT